jgi:nucleotidyltransferase substrate binding protein (TIGR01987 family)
MIDYSKLQSSLKHLELQYENYSTLDDALPILLKEGVKESVIQRFEVCFYTLWKCLKRYMIESLGLADLPSSPKPIFKIANENKLFASPLEDWLAYADARTNTSHDYSHKKAEDAIKVIASFIDDAIGIYQTMTGKTWE